MPDPKNKLLKKIYAYVFSSLHYIYIHFLDECACARSNTLFSRRARGRRSPTLPFKHCGGDDTFRCFIYFIFDALTRVAFVHNLHNIIIICQDVKLDFSYKNPSSCRVWCFASVYNNSVVLRPYLKYFIQ